MAAHVEGSGVSKSGFLKKRGAKGLIKSMKQRWFVLRGAALSYYRAQDDAAPAADPIMLEGSVIDQDRSASNANTFLIATADKGRVYELQASDAETMWDWIRTLRAVVAKRKRHDLSDVPAIVDDTYVLTVRGMRCDDCAATLQSALASVGGVMGVSVDLEGEACAVSAEVWVNPELLMTAVEKEGFIPLLTPVGEADQ